MFIRGFQADKPQSFAPISESGVYLNGRLVSCTMRPNQRHVFENHRSARLMLVNQPPGSGKSTLIKFVHAHDLLANPNRKLIIVVPQQVIAKTFRGGTLEYDNGSTVEWDTAFDLCEDRTSKIEETVRFMLNQEHAQGIMQRIMLCTHQSLALAFSRIVELGKVKECFKNTSYIVDEAHHILNSVSQDDLDMSNRLGEFVKEFMRYNDLTAKLWFVTATWHRGDRLSILNNKDMKKFEVHHLPMDKHWRENIHHIQSYSFDFVTYENNVWDALREILRRGKRKTIIYAPQSNRPIAQGCKYAFTEKIKAIIHEEWGESNILDLVEELGRNDRKIQLEDEQQSRHLDAVIAINMVNEGTDWPSAESIIDLSPSNSLRIQVQRWGRLIRDLKGKKHLNYYMLLPYSLAQIQDEESYRRTLNQNFAAFTASLLIEDSIRPISIPKPDTGTGLGQPRNLSVFQQEVPDDNERRAMIDAVATGLLVLRGASDESLTNTQIRDHVQDIIRDNGVTDHVDEIAKIIVGMLRRRAIQFDVDVSWTIDMGFEKIWRDEIFENLLSFVTGVCGVSTFAEFRRIYETREQLEWDEMYERVKAEAVKNAKG